jgi:hypothetical protein
MLLWWNAWCIYDACTRARKCESRSSFLKLFVHFCAPLFTERSQVPNSDVRHLDYIPNLQIRIKAPSSWRYWFEEARSDPRGDESISLRFGRSKVWLVGVHDSMSKMSFWMLRPCSNIRVFGGGCRVRPRHDHRVYWSKSYTDSVGMRNLYVSGSGRK